MPTESPSGLVILGALSTVAWVYPEHRAIFLIAIQKLDNDRRSVLDELWRQARVGHVDRLAQTVADLEQREKPSQIDYSAWPAIAGDHSCSPENLSDNGLTSDWILEVADVAAHLKNHLDDASREAGDDLAEQNARRDNAMRNADLPSEG